jgi:Carotenoid biosynthesis protein
MAEDAGGAGRVWVRRAGQALLVVFLLAVVTLAGRPTPFAQALAGIGVIIAFAHGVHVYGWSGTLLFLSLCLTVTFATENLSIATGFPFGHYHFEVAAALPHIGTVPVIVGLLYFAMGYFSWMIASLLLDDADAHLNRPFYVTETRDDSLAARPGFSTYVYRLAPSDIERFVSLLAALHGSGSLGIGIATKEFCLVGPLPPEPLLSTTYLWTSKPQNYVVVTNDLDLRREPTIAAELSKLGPC